MGSKGRPRPSKPPRQQRRDRAAALRGQGLPFSQIGRRLGISKQAAWRMVMRPAGVGTGSGVRCSACRVVVTTRHIQQRTVGDVLCRGCLAARSDAPFALRLRSHRVAAELTRKELTEAAGLGTGRAKDFEQGGAKPQRATRARLAKALRAPDLERFGDEGQGRGMSPLPALSLSLTAGAWACNNRAGPPSEFPAAEPNEPATVSAIRRS
jgi:transcriptional regulator with XRE-family HTH domain